MFQCQIGETKSCPALFSPKTVPLICFSQHHSGKFDRTQGADLRPDRQPIHATNMEDLVRLLDDKYSEHSYRRYHGAGRWHRDRFLQRAGRQIQGQNLMSLSSTLHHATAGASNAKSQTLFRCVSDTGSYSLCLHGLITRNNRLNHVSAGGPQPAGMVLFL